MLHCHWFLYYRSVFWNGSFRRGKPSAGRPNALKVNLLDKPLGVSKDGLRFSWSFEDPDANEYQSAYRIVVASSKAQFLQKEYVYDSGWSDASASSGVEPAGLPECLTDNGLYYWAVQVRDSQGLERRAVAARDACH